MKKRGISGFRAQAAMEFLMAYGWVLVVMVIVIAALSHFGVLSPERSIPGMCILEPGISCIDSKVNESSVVLVLANGRGESINISGIRIGSCNGTASGILSNMEQYMFTISGCNNTPKNLFKGEISIIYSGESKLTHKNEGSIVSIVEEGPNSGCGDAACGADETCSTCSADCGACPAQCKDGIDNDGDSLIDYPADTGCSDALDDTELSIFCGDGACNSNETCSTCSTDCGACTALSLESPYGVNDWNFINDSMDAMQEAGIKWIRIMVNWGSLEAVQGQYTWNQGANNNIDFYINQAQKYGMKVSVSVYNAPAWARIMTNEFWIDSDAYANFVAALLNRYPGKIDAVEVLNEDSTISWPDTKWRDAYYYIPILTKAYSTVKAINSSIIVTTSALWASPVGYLEDLYILGAKDYFDAVNFHYYPGKNSPSTSYTWLISHYRKVMEKYGDGNKPIWLTEFGWNIDDAAQNAANIVSPQQQSDYMAYVLDASMKSGFVEKVFLYVWHGDDGMTAIHTTNNYYWNTYQPTLVSSIWQEDTSLTVSKTTQTASGSIRTINWTIAWPRNGVLIVENEKMRYSSTALTADGDTDVLGLVRGIDGTTAASHSAGARVSNQDQTANFRRQIYYTYKNFIQANPTWDASNIAPLPDVPQPVSAPIAVSNAGFESSKTAWLQPNNFDIDNLEYYSGTASARINRASGDGGTKRSAHSALAVEPGKSYFLKAWVKIDPSGDANMNAMVTGNLQDSSGRYLSNVPSNYYIHKTNGNWREIHYPFRTTAETAQLVLYISTSFSSMEHGAATAWFDDITIEPYILS